MDKDLLENLESLTGLRFDLHESGGLAAFETFDYRFGTLYGCDMENAVKFAIYCINKALSKNAPLDESSPEDEKTISVSEHYVNELNKYVGNVLWFAQENGNDILYTKEGFDSPKIIVKGFDLENILRPMVIIAQMVQSQAFQDKEIQVLSEQPLEDESFEGLIKALQTKANSLGMLVHLTLSSKETSVE